ncbi:hypothetical protein ACVSUJ_07250 [Yersinia enterocolitica]|uniref:hypothetical protein n=1 Tax=Yersinia enterocolitica TaxID=630 RepID=UPI00215552F1|nr:hypothetical protein [Yersinia enterocolitica]
MATIHTFTRPQNGKRLQFSPETCGKLHRAQSMLTYLFAELHSEQESALLQFGLHHLIGYLRSDLRDIREEAHKLGLLPDTPQN